MAFTAADAEKRHPGLGKTQAQKWVDAANAALNKALSEQVPADKAGEKALAAADAALKDAAPKSEQFIEFESFAGQSIQAPESGIITGIKLAGFSSRNGYTYTREAFEKAIQLYEGKPVFLDHSANRTNPRDRSVRDLAGTVKNPRLNENGVFGDVDLFDNEAGRTLREIIRKNNTQAGMSQTVLALRDRARGEVSKIEDVISVDAVVYPATTNTFTESSGGGGMDATQEEPPATPPLSESKGSTMDLSKLTLEQIRESRPDLIKAISEEQTSATELETLRNQLTEATKKVEAFELKERQTQLVETIRTELTDAGLDCNDAKAVSEAFMAQLLKCDTPEERKALMDDRAALIGESEQSHGSKLPPKPKTGKAPASGSDNLTEALQMPAQDVLRQLRG